MNRLKSTLALALAASLCVVLLWHSHRTYGPELSGGIITYPIPVIAPASIESPSEHGCLDAMQRAYGINRGYLNNPNIRKATAFRPVITRAKGFTDQQYQRSCSAALSGIAGQNIEIHAHLEAK